MGIKTWNLHRVVIHSTNLFFVASGTALTYVERMSTLSNWLQFLGNTRVYC